MQGPVLGHVSIVVIGTIATSSKTTFLGRVCSSEQIRNVAQGARLWMSEIHVYR